MINTPDSLVRAYQSAVISMAIAARLSPKAASSLRKPSFSSFLVTLSRDVFTGAALDPLEPQKSTSYQIRED